MTIPEISNIPPLRAAIDRETLGADDVLEILEFLVDRNPAWLTFRNQDGSLPLHVAVEQGASLDCCCCLYEFHFIGYSPGHEISSVILVVLTSL
jgi:hypothetical protein